MKVNSDILTDSIAQSKIKDFNGRLTNKVTLGDSLKLLPIVSNNSFDLAIIDPPYNLSKGNVWKWDNSAKLPGLGGDWKKVLEKWDSMPLINYFEFTLAWLEEIKRIVTPKGSIWIHGTYHNIGIINFALQLLNIEIINEVIWYKRNSFPNLSGRRLTASHETIIWAHTGKKREYNFNYKNSKQLDFPEDKLKAPGKQMRTVWDIPNNKTRQELAFGKHPTQKPLRLIDRMLLLSAKEDNKCIIPFAGAGSECIACMRRGIPFLAIEKDLNYVTIANNRIANHIKQENQ